MTRPYDDDQSAPYEPTQIAGSLPEMPDQAGYGGQYPGQPHSTEYPASGGYPTPGGYPVSGGYPAAGGYPTGPRGGGHQWILAIALIAGLIAVGTVTFLVVKNLGGSGGGTTAGDASSAVTVTSTHTESAPAEQTTVTRTATAQTTAATTAAGGSAPLGVSGTDAHGFTDGGPTCDDSADPVIFIGRTYRSQVLICQVGAQEGRYYYKALADGASKHIDFPARSGQSITASSGAVRYIISPDRLLITENGSTIGDEPWRQSWWR